MAPHDSDSSDEDTENYTTTNVVLGYASKEPTDDSISQLGGRPTWLGQSEPPSAALARCMFCNNIMPLLLQLHADIPEHFPDHDRRLYVFACRKKACRRRNGSIKAVRGIKLRKPARATNPSTNNTNPPQAKPSTTTAPPTLGNSIFGVTSSPASSVNPNPFSSPAAGSGNPFSSNPFSAPPTNTSPNPIPTVAINDMPSDLPATFADKVRLSNPPAPPPSPAAPEPWPSESDLPTPYPSYHLDADYETLDQPAELPIPTTSMNVDDPPGGSSSSTKEDADTFESTIDKTFQRFADRLAQNPLQVVRYEFGGLPLLYSKTDFVGQLISLHHSSSNTKVSVTRRGGTSGFGASACLECGATRVFELQLTPQAISELEAEEDGLEGMEWGNVIVGVCGKDCGGEVGRVTYFQEWVGVQWEERGKG
ncbi:hypothetical protein MMC30_006679 [Trapelia coarctata]|nr:hypothetical protein [Trapelia coarctata]